MTNRDQDLRTSFVIRQLGEIEVNGPDGLERITGLLLEGDVSSIRLASVWFGESICVVPAAAPYEERTIMNSRTLLQRLRQYEGQQSETTACYNGLRDEAAAEISDLRSRLTTLQSELDEARGALTGAARDVLAERRRQIEAEGWTREHDDAHEDESLARAAACYAENPELVTPGWPGGEKPRPQSWPRSWSARWWKPTDRRRDLVKAGALILAEIERLDRAATRTAGGDNGE